MNGQKHVIDNSDTAAQSLFGKGNQHLNYLRKRGLDGVFLKTNDHWMELFFPVDLGVAAINKISVFDLDRGPRTKRVHELQNVYPEVRDDGDIRVLNRCYLGSLDGSLNEIEGKASTLDDTYARLLVDFDLGFDLDFDSSERAGFQPAQEVSNPVPCRGTPAVPQAEATGSFRDLI